MVTSDILARGDGAVHVAHSFTVHAEEAEPDYFTAVDDLTREEGELGAGLIQTSELTSGLFYGYVVVDVPLLVANLSSDTVLAAGLLECLVHLIATTSPGAKRGSTAPYGYADLVLLEAGERQPRSLAGAFHRPVPLDDVRQKAGWAIADHLRRFNAMYGAHETRRVATMLDLDGLDAVPGSLAELATWAAARVREGSA
jgi:CRISPR system Cascade subunit CasC